MIMTFSEIANLLYPYCGEGVTNAEFVIILVDNFMEEPTDGDASGEYNPLTGLVARSLENFFSGSRPIGKKNASKILKHMDKARFESFIDDSLSNDAISAIANSLESKEIEASALNASSICANLMETAIHMCSVGMTIPINNVAVTETADELAPNLPKRRFAPLIQITPPDEVAEQEIAYVRKLMAAYGEAEGVAGFSKESLKQFEHKYGEHFKRQRKDFYAAESVRQGTRETYGETDPDQFEVLKEETYDGVIDVIEQPHLNGYVRLNAVLAQATHIRIDRCWLCRDTDWIGNSQKKVCAMFLRMMAR